MKQGRKKFLINYKKLQMDHIIDWSNLPNDMIHMVFARLPLTQIIHLQILSKEWYQKAKEPWFRKLCASALAPSLPMYAWIEAEDGKKMEDLGVFKIMLCESEAKKWHKFKVETPFVEQNFDTMFACDGGLVCFVSRMRDLVAKPLTILVVNPLTREWQKLPSYPPLEEVQELPKMVQVIMDHATNCYKVFVLTSLEGSIGWVAWVYYSATKTWNNTKSIPENIFGYYYDWSVWKENDQFVHTSPLAPSLIGYFDNPCVYNCSTNEIIEAYFDFDWDKLITPYIDMTIVDGQLFVLHHMTTRHCKIEDVSIRYYILEFQWHMEKQDWIEKKVHLCTGFGDEDLKGAQLQGFKGFLVAYVDYYEASERKGALSYMYDLSTSEWNKISPCDIKNPSSSLVCEVRWDAIP